MKNQENNTNQQYTPMLRKWDIVAYVDSNDITQAVRGLIQVVKTGESYRPYHRIDIEGDSCGRDGFADGTRIRTSPVVEISRVDRPITPQQMENSSPAEIKEHCRALVSARTRSGTCYYLYIDDSEEKLQELIKSLGMPECYLAGSGDTKPEK